MEKILKEITGIFDGRNLVTEDGCAIVVPENYASKSMLISGTGLIYRITDKGSYFKQTNTPPCRTAIAKVVMGPRNLMAEIITDGAIYQLNFLSAFKYYYKLKSGDEVVVAFPEKLSLFGENWCAIEAKLS